ncbi:MAG: integrase [Gammaproteobacteria bacterium]|nr:integrase [Gammaproteobacteria bacterium]MDE0269689.1 integrase [Gammaproteobacteria bacterium]
MIVTLQIERMETLDEVRAFVEGSGPVDFKLADRESAYGFVRRTLVRFRYHVQGKAAKGLLRAFLGKATGLSRAQLARLIRQHRETGEVEDRRRGPPARPFERQYTKADIRLLAEVDRDLGQASGPATRKSLRRMFEVFGDARFERLAGLSNGHLYNLRRSRTYWAARATVEPTRASQVPIGQRRRPDPQGRPGFLRVDTVHQGDLDGVKGVYHVNLVDEVTQWQHVGTVEAISERFMVPVLEGLIEAFPFAVKGFHADNGSEYVNHHVAGLLNRLHVEDFTKSRARRSNDNALVEGKNGSVVRKWLGHGHIPKAFAADVDAFTQGVLSPFLNFHRPCLFPTVAVDGKGRTKRRYREEDVATPYERFRSLPDAARWLRPGVTFEALDETAMARNDLEAAKAVNAARDELFRRIGKAWAAA